MSTSDLQQGDAGSRAFGDWRTRFGPYLVLHSTPWLLLATALRIHARAQGNLFSLGLLVAVEYALLIALLLVCHRMIQLSGGDVDLERLSFREQSRLARALVWRLLAVFFVCVIGSVLLGLDRYYAAALWFGLDNIVYPWPGRYLPFWSAFIAILVYLMLVEKGEAGRLP